MTDRADQKTKPARSAARVAAALLAGVALLPASAVLAQSGGQNGARTSGRAAVPPGAIVQPLPASAAVDRLNQNLSRLSRSPQDVNALIGAGQAALDLGDVQAANGFFTRANMVDPRQGKAKLGLAIVSLALKQPQDAAAYFDEADAMGERAENNLAERGLAYDLTGQQAKAQADYRAALARKPDDRDTRMRYAVSLGIAGDVAAAEKQLEPALANGDREAWRNRAFILAMNGRVSDARAITQSTMPKGLADALDPYIQRIALLTPAQRAAAVQFGSFPADVLQRPAPSASSGIQLASRTETRRQRSRRSSETPTPTPAPIVTPPPPPPIILAAATPPPAPVIRSPAATATPTNILPNRTPSPAPSTPAPTFTPPLARTTSTPVPTTTTNPTPTATPAASPSPLPAFTMTTVSTGVPTGVQGPVDPGTGAAPIAAATVAATSTASFPPASTPPASAPPATANGTVIAPPPSAPRPQLTRTLADIIADVEVTESTNTRVAPVDLAVVARFQDDRRKAEAKAAADKAKKEAAAKAKAEAAAKAKAAAEEKARIARNPARIWVQIATGRDIGALAFDLRRMRKSYGDAIGDMGGWSAEWGATRRLLIGPYAASAKAKAAVSDIKQSGGDAFVFQSEAGEEVTKLGAK